MNKNKILIMLLFSLFPFWMQAEEVACVLPKPAHISVQNEKGFQINAKTVIYATPQASATAELWAATLRKGTGLELPVKVTSRAANKQGICFVLPEKTTDTESYNLNITTKRVLIESQGAAGLFYGAQTVNQLLPAEVLEEKGNIQKISLPSLTVQDSPRFKWRGYMQDVSRTFYSMDVLKKYIDVMALYKLNTLHLHLTDDQG
jgi:hexosaminidase